ncbi:AraC family transcriptional regulator [Ruminococcaceae bacterium OttesenSCG-928-A16]|nr:AraC family transcriptional regulator [Ruminococcaceae bacterium OttesenSCG-928-A16]
MVKEYIYSPHYDFYIDRAQRAAGYDMKTFHIHKKYEIYYEVEGTRRYYIDDAAYLVNAGNTVMIGPDSVHKAVSVENMPHTRYVLNFNHEYLDNLAQAFPGVNLFECFSSGLHVLQVSPKKQAVIESLLARIWEHYEDPSAEALAMRKAQLVELLLTLSQYTKSAKQGQQGKISNKTIDKIQSYISTHYKENLTLTSIAAQFYVSPFYLSRLFKKTTNLSIIEYINSVRLMAGKNLLETTHLKVAEIAEEIGFTTTTHFSRIFKEGTGLSPQQYRKYYHTAQKDA